MTQKLCTPIILSAVLLALAGCGSGRKTAYVKGAVLYAGKPVHGGMLIFGPVGNGKVGEPASATIQEDGSYSLGTYRAGDGAVIGKHRVIFTPPQPKLTDEQRTDPNFEPPPPEFQNMIPKEAEVEVKPGQNTIDIELVPR